MLKLHGRVFSGYATFDFTIIGCRCFLPAYILFMSTNRCIFQRFSPTPSAISEYDNDKEAYYRAREL
jgi:hypothetical protein